MWSRQDEVILTVIDGFYDFREMTVIKAISLSANCYKQELGSYSNSSELEWNNVNEDTFQDLMD